MRENMKKVLLATSILAASTGFAAAEVALSGSARMGVIYDGADYAFSSRVRVVFTMSGETDGGLAFGASVRADQTGGNDSDAGAVPGETGTNNGDSTVFISGDFGKLTMGDVGGAADALVGQTSGVGYGPNDGLQEIGFIGTTKTAAYYEYSSGPFTVGLGAGQPTSAGSEVNIGAKYAMGDYTVAIGYEQSDTSIYEDMISASASAKFGAATVKAKITDPGATGADTAWSVSVDYVTGATTITAFYTDFGNTGLGSLTTVGVDTQHVGLGAAYDLGGGATLAGGIVQQMTPGGDTTLGDVGVKFSF
jgi:outer membrane protein OmpU